MLQTKTGRVRDHFVEECMKVLPEHEACVTRIDEAVAAAREHRADLVMCATRLGEGTAEVDRCRKAAEDKAKRRVGVCGETLDRILAPIEESYRREQLQRTVDEKKTETKVFEAKLEPRTP